MIWIITVLWDATQWCFKGSRDIQKGRAAGTYSFSQIILVIVCIRLLICPLPLCMNVGEFTLLAISFLAYRHRDCQSFMKYVKTLILGVEKGLSRLSRFGFLCWCPCDEFCFFGCSNNSFLSLFFFFFFFFLRPGGVGLLAINSRFFWPIFSLIMQPPASFIIAMQEYVRDAPLALSVRKDQVWKFTWWSKLVSSQMVVNWENHKCSMISSQAGMQRNIDIIK